MITLSRNLNKKAQKKFKKIDCFSIVKVKPIHADSITAVNNKLFERSEPIHCQLFFF
jgi:hypothetical protein